MHNTSERGGNVCRRAVIYVLAAVLGVAAALAVTSVFTVMTVRGTGMEPSLTDGSSVLINRLAYTGDGSVPDVGELIAVRSYVYGEDGEGRIIVRRVAGAPGDTVEIRDNVFYLNGRPYEEYMKEPVHMDDMKRIKLGHDELFVLSDNRKSSMDSRNEAIGVLKIEDCVGKVSLKWKLG